VIVAWVGLHLPFVQNWIAKKVAGNFSEKLQYQGKHQAMLISPLQQDGPAGFLIEDQQRDTLLYAGTAKVSITDWFFLKGESHPEIYRAAERNDQYEKDRFSVELPVPGGLFFGSEKVIFKRRIGIRFQGHGTSRISFLTGSINGPARI